MTRVVVDVECGPLSYDSGADSYLKRTSCLFDMGTSGARVEGEPVAAFAIDHVVHGLVLRRIKIREVSSVIRRARTGSLAMNLSSR
jgi:hypothetical protein